MQPSNPSRPECGNEIPDAETGAQTVIADVLEETTQLPTPQTV
jgi:hypothetical protein